MKTSDLASLVDNHSRHKIIMFMFYNAPIVVCLMGQVSFVTVIVGCRINFAYLTVHDKLKYYKEPPYLENIPLLFSFVKKYGRLRLAFA